MKKRGIASALGLLVASALVSGTSYGYEVCTLEGPCTIRGEIAETGDPVWITTEAGINLRYIFEGDGDWLIVDHLTYLDLAQLVPDEEKFVVPGVNPNNGLTLAEKGGTGTGTAPKSGGTSGGTSGGLVTIEGSFNVNVGGSSCSDCHKGTHAQIHAKKLPNDK